MLHKVIIASLTSECHGLYYVSKLNDNIATFVINFLRRHLKEHYLQLTFYALNELVSMVKEIPIVYNTLSK